MDSRLIFIFFPVIIALSWAFYNAGRLGFQQIRRISQNS